MTAKTNSADKVNADACLLNVEKLDHPDIAGGIVWTDGELEWIRAYGMRCYNYGAQIEDKP